MSQQTIVKELDDSAAFVLQKCFRGDDDAIPHAKQLFLKLLSHLDVKETIREMDECFWRSQYIFNLVGKPEYHPRELRTLKATKRETFREIRRTLAYELENYAGPTLAAKIQEMKPSGKDLPWTGVHVDWGVIAAFELRKRSYLALARLLYALREELGGGDRFSLYIPLLRAYYANLIKGTDSKLEDEKMILQAIVCAAFHPHGFSFEDLERYVDVGMSLVGFHWAVGFNPELTEARLVKQTEWLNLHNEERVGRFRSWMDETLRNKTHSHLQLLLQTPYVEGIRPDGKSRPSLFPSLIPTAFFEVPPEHWKVVLSKNELLPSQVLTGTIPLRPIPPRRLSMLFPHRKLVPVDGVFGPQGGGKTVLGLALDAIRIRRGYVIFQPTITREQAIFCCLPSLPVCVQAKHDHDFLMKKLKIQPQSVPSQFLTICGKDNQLSNSVWTIYDQVIYVDRLSEFSLDWSGILRDFPCGQLIIRSLQSDTDTNTMRATLLKDFFRWRELNRHRKIAIAVDELQHIFMSEVSSPQEAKMKAATGHVLPDIRGNNLPLRFGAISPGFVQPSVLEMCTSAFFGELKESGSEQSKTTRGKIMDLVQKNFLSDEDSMFLPIVDRIMRNRPLRDESLFFWASKGHPLRLVKACLPPHMLELTNVNIRDIFREAEKQLERRILVDFSEVPRTYAGRVKGRKSDQEIEVY